MPLGAGWKSVRVYEKSGPTIVKIGEVLPHVSNIALPDVAAGVHQYVLRSVVDGVESPDGSPVTINVPAAPKPPTGLQQV